MADALCRERHLFSRFRPAIPITASTLTSKSPGDVKLVALHPRYMHTRGKDF